MAVVLSEVRMLSGFLILSLYQNLNACIPPKAILKPWLSGFLILSLSKTKCLYHHLKDHKVCALKLEFNSCSAFQR